MPFKTTEEGQKNLGIIKAFFADNPRWITIRDLSNVTNVNQISLRNHCLNLLRQGYLEETKMKIWSEKPHRFCDAYHYRLSD